MRLLTLLFVSGAAFAAGPLSFGIKGGVPLTDAFAGTTASGVDVITRAYSNSKNYVVGPMAELNLPFGLGVEADALYRPLNLTTLSTIAPAASALFSTDINSWEFPMLGKYRLSAPLVKPYIEAGPVFRWVGSGGSHLSNSGFAFGGGVDVKLLLIKITPEIRFTRWAGDSSAGPINVAPSNLNQAQFLIGISF